MTPRGSRSPRHNPADVEELVQLRLTPRDASTPSPINVSFEEVAKTIFSAVTDASKGGKFIKNLRVSRVGAGGHGEPWVGRASAWPGGPAPRFRVPWVSWLGARFAMSLEQEGTLRRRTIAEARRDEQLYTARREKEEELEKDDGELEISRSCCAIIVAVVVAIFAVLIYFLSGPIDPLDSRVTSLAGDQVLRTVVWPQRGAGGLHGPNGRDTDWAVTTATT